MAIALLLGAGAAPVARAAEEPAGKATPPAHADLRGTWTLNPELTAALARDQRGSGPGGGFHGGGSGRHRHGGGTDGDPGGAGGGHETGDGGSHVAALGTLAISEESGTITIADGAGRRRELRPDGRKVRDESGPWGAASLRASWDADGDLLVEIEPDKGPKRSESYVVAHDRKHLYVTVTLSSGLFGAGNKIVHAYDPATPASAPDPPSAPSPPPTGGS